MLARLKSVSLGAGVAIALILGASTASAATITLGGSGGGIYSLTTNPLVVQAQPLTGKNGQPLIQASVNCASCFGFVWDTTQAILDTSAPLFASAFDYNPANESMIASVFSNLLGLTGEDIITATNVTKIDLTTEQNGSNFTFDVASDYFFVKYGQYTSFFSTGGNAQSVTFAGKPGLSNYGEIPVPAAGLLLLSGLGGLAALRRRRKFA